MFDWEERARRQRKDKELFQQMVARLTEGLSLIRAAMQLSYQVTDGVFAERVVEITQDLEEKGTEALKDLTGCKDFNDGVVGVQYVRKQKRRAMLGRKRKDLCNPAPSAMVGWPRGLRHWFAKPEVDNS